MFRVWPALVLTVAGAATAPAATETPGVAEFDYGYFCALEPVDEGVAEGTISGTVSFVEGPPPFIATGPLVPARIGIGFGVHVRARDGFAGDVTVVIEHPPMGPDRVTRQVWITHLSADERDYLGYSFDYEYELVTGPWRMSASSDGRLVYAAEFEVLAAALMPDPECGKMPIS